MPTHQKMTTPKSDPVLKYGLWFGILAFVLGIIPGSIACIYSGKAVEIGVLGLIVTASIAAGLISLLRNDD